MQVLLKIGRWYKKQHLKNCINRAKKNHNTYAEKKILAINQREKDRSLWRRLSYSMEKSRGGSVKSVQIERDFGEINMVRVHRKQFYLAEQATIFQGSLRGDFRNSLFTNS